MYDFTYMEGRATIRGEDADQQLLRRHKKGDPHAFGVLVERHRDRAYRVAFRLTRDHDDAEDIVAEAFVRAYKGLNAFSGNAAFTTWLYRILTNCFLDKRRNPNRPKLVSLEGVRSDDGEGVELQLPSREASPHDFAERDAQRERLLSALARLQPQYQAIITLYHADMLSYEEIAEVLQMPIGTVKSRLNRARLAMRDQLTNERELFAVA